MTLTRKYGLGIKTEIELEEGTEFGSSQLMIDKEEAVIVGHESISSNLKKENEFDEIHFKYQDFYSITIPENYPTRKPIYIKINNIMNSCTHIHIIAKKNSSSEIIIELNSVKSVSFSSLFIEIRAEENARINYNELNNLETGVFYVKRYGVAEENAKINWLTCDVGAQKVISDTKTLLDGKHSETKTNNVYFSNYQKFDIHSEAEHNNEFTKSDLKSKGVLKNSESFFRGLIKINENAPESNGYQKSDTLLLGDSRSVSIPDLLIHNDKVRCSHGSSTTRLDEEKMFYMQSRGLSKREAEREYVQGFLEPALKGESPEILPRFLSVVMEKVRKEENVES